ncbi:hypothetical protein SALBM135S_07001 [Streptomyces alboniger]
MERLEDHHLQWMARLDAMEEADGHLLMHSDTTAYLDYGDSIEAVNDTVRETLTRNDADECWDLFLVHQALRLPRRVGFAGASCSTCTAAHASSMVTAPSRTSWVTSAPRTSRTARDPSSKARTSTPTAWPSPWTAE